MQFFPRRRSEPCTHWLLTLLPTLTPMHINTGKKKKGGKKGKGGGKKAASEAKHLDGLGPNEKTLYYLALNNAQRKELAARKREVEAVERERGTLQAEGAVLKEQLNEKKESQRMIRSVMTRQVRPASKLS